MFQATAPYQHTKAKRAQITVREWEEEQTARLSSLPAGDIRESEMLSDLEGRVRRALNRATDGVMRQELERGYRDVTALIAHDRRENALHDAAFAYQRQRAAAQTT